MKIYSNIPRKKDRDALALSSKQMHGAATYSNIQRDISSNYQLELAIQHRASDLIFRNTNLLHTFFDTPYYKMKFVQHLQISHRNLTEIPDLPPALISLDCRMNKLTALPTLPSTLKELYCDINQLTRLPTLPPTLRALDCSRNKIQKLPTQLPATLEIYMCTWNDGLTSLPATLPPKLKWLFCANGQLTELPPLPSTLTRLECADNRLRSLPKLPPKLDELDCSANQLRSLPALPSSLTELNCSENQLTSLPPSLSSTKIIMLDCSDNRLTAAGVPTLPRTVHFPELRMGGNLENLY